MRLLDKIRSIWRRHSFPTLDQVDSFLDYLAGAGGLETWSGANVSPATALRMTAVWRCIEVIAGSLAQMPLITYHVLENGGKERAREHYLYSLLHDRVNPLLTSYRFKHLMQTWLGLHGNAYAALTVSGRGQVTALTPWHPSRVSVELRGSEPIYVYRSGAQEPVEMPWYNMLHLRGLGTDGFFGLSPISQHRQTLGMSLAMQEHGARFFSNGALPSGVIEVPGRVTDKEALRTEWHRVYGGASNAHRVAVLTDGMKFARMTPASLSDLQYIEGMNFQVTDICRIFGVPPHKAFQLERSTNNNIEQQEIEWRADCLGPWLANWEQELNNILLSDRERKSVMVEFLTNSMLRTDAAGRAAYYARALQFRWMTPNEVRRLENMNPVDIGDEFLVTNNAAAPARRPTTGGA